MLAAGAATAGAAATSRCATAPMRSACRPRGRSTTSPPTPGTASASIGMRSTWPASADQRCPTHVVAAPRRSRSSTLRAAEPGSARHDPRPRGAITPRTSTGGRRRGAHRRAVRGGPGQRHVARSPWPRAANPRRRAPGPRGRGAAANAAAPETAPAQTPRAAGARRTTSASTPARHPHGRRCPPGVPRLMGWRGLHRRGEPRVQPAEPLGGLVRDQIAAGGG